MQQFLVPQFIDVEDKVIGPITTRQFVIMLVCALLIFIEYRLSRVWLFAVEGLLTFGLLGTIAFIKINGMPFHFFLLNLAQTMRRSRVRIWDKKLSDADLKELMKIEVKEEAQKEIAEKRVTEVRLSKLSLVVNTGGYYKAEEEEEKKEEEAKETLPPKTKQPKSISSLLKET